MQAWRSLSALLLGAALSACAQPPPAETSATPAAAAASAAAETSGDPLPRFIGVIGIRAQHAPPFLGVPETNFYCLRSFVDRRTGETRHQLYVSDSYSGAERHWNAARDGDGRPLRVVAISRHEITCEGGCSYLEEFAANIPEGELRANPRSLTVIFTANSGAEKTIVVSGDQITSQLAAMDARRDPTAGLTRPAAPQPSPSHQ
jgi:hypothetical protein